ncbi:MAG: L-serine ammonia-lyase, iron-sulfur-dependent subunit beta [Clostridia bacterium]|nr:L-serine ammonia-lyase, iron-sulfur-dependent subunit beta [Clostridia bacterium]
MGLNIFDIIGPVMIGPSSSHTAGAVRIGRIAGVILGEPVKKAKIFLHGSFAQTYKGHGTNLALVAGLLGYDTDNPKIKQALIEADNQGMEVEFIPANLGSGFHPNTAKLVLTGASGNTTTVTGASVGGGNIVITQINQFKVDISGDYHALIVSHEDKPGAIAKVTALLAEDGVNVAEMKVSREQKGDLAMMVIETDQEVSSEILAKIHHLSLTSSAIMVKPI